MKTIIITGANRGIGLEMVKQYQQDQWHVIACCRQPEQAIELQQLAENSAHNLKIFSLDVQDIVSMQSFKNAIGQTSIDVLVNNAGILGKSGRQTVGSLYNSPQTALEIFQVNTLGALFLSELLLTHIAKSQIKTIVNISSNLGSITLNEWGGFCILYRASKSALNSITQAMSVALKDQHIKVVAIHPGWVKTDMGGADAYISPEGSVRGIKNIIDHLDLNETGSFLQYDGEVLPW